MRISGIITPHEESVSNTDRQFVFDANSFDIMPSVKKLTDVICEFKPQLQEKTIMQYENCSDSASVGDFIHPEQMEVLLMFTLCVVMERVLIEVYSNRAKLSVENMLDRVDIGSIAYEDVYNSVQSYIEHDPVGEEQRTSQEESDLLAAEDDVICCLATHACCELDIFISEWLGNIHTFIITPVFGSNPKPFKYVESLEFKTSIEYPTLDRRAVNYDKPEKPYRVYVEDFYENPRFMFKITY